jgi:uncharacterized protein YoxC
MTVGGIAGLIAAVAFVALVGLIAVPLLRLGKVLDEVRGAVRDLGQESVPILTELQGTVKATNEELARLTVVTDDVARLSKNASSVTENAAQMSTLLTTSLSAPLIKVAAIREGFRRALNRGPSADLDVTPRRVRTEGPR